MRKRLRKAAFFAMSVMMVMGTASCSSDDDDNGDDSSNGGIGGGTGLPGQGTASWTISGNENENISAALAVVVLDTEYDNDKYNMEITLSTATIDNPTMNSYNINFSLVHETNPFDSLQTNTDYELRRIGEEGVITVLLATPNVWYAQIESGTLRFQELSMDKVEATFEFEAVWNDETTEVTNGSFETNFIQIEPQETLY